VEKEGIEVEAGDDMWAKLVSESSNLMFYFGKKRIQGLI
jgi:hypothetical protein